MYVPGFGAGGSGCVLGSAVEGAPNVSVDHDRVGVAVREPLRFRVQGAGFRVQSSGLNVQDSGFRFAGLGFRDCGIGCRVESLGLRDVEEDVMPVGWGT